jgi:hypothetical protein
MLWELIFQYHKRKESEFGEHNQEEIGIKLNKLNNDLPIEYLYFCLFFGIII